MRRYVFPALIALLAELTTSWWRWVRAPTDGLRVYYRGNFWAYAAEQLAAWIVIFVILYGIFILADRIFLKRLSLSDRK
ncbi:MAG TPA: hypothetical protein VGO56_22590 [Pyrinomonadaceae bacterium]|jgi:hypothetical protein|nr:hypothetical protein [Pyrinomonadaceae bacterium]